MPHAAWAVLLYAVCLVSGVGRAAAQCDAGSTSSQCACDANKFSETIVLNPPETARIYSSQYTATAQSMLDTMDWNGQEYWDGGVTAGEYMQIDAGQSMHIVGVMIQGARVRDLRTFGYATEIGVSYSSTGSAGSFTASGNADGSSRFFMSSREKVEKTLPTPVFARYIRIMVYAFSYKIHMRAALVVKTCLSCIDGAVSNTNSASSAACQCAANEFLVLEDRKSVV